ncbi:MAG: hypothetical protein AMK72_01450 [Planctomycetes bacterium SM23_25]|nr:MAG: hypothetical protein AMK72_01450 [Planctomycetes bacterium SM23_25]
MAKRNKPVRLSAHAASYRTKRGFTAEEVEQAIREAPWQEAQRGRTECRLDFAFDGTWNGKSYATKQVRPIFAEEANEIVVVTVYTYYF